MALDDNRSKDAKSRLRQQLRMLRLRGKVDPPAVQSVEPNMRTAAVLHPRLDKRQP